MKEEPISSGVLVGAIGGALLGTAGLVFVLGAWVFLLPVVMAVYVWPLSIAAVLIGGLLMAAGRSGDAKGCCGCFLSVLFWPVTISALIGAVVGVVVTGSLTRFIILVRNWWRSRRGP